MVAGAAPGSATARRLAARRALVRTVLIALTFAAAMAFCLRDVLASGFDLGFGDRADGLIEISILEHWRNVLHGFGDWRTPIYFHPYRDTLGYNDGYFLYGLVYSLLRIWFDPFISDTLNILVFKAIGFFSALVLMRSVFGWRLGAALLASVLFAIANSLALQSVHAQLQTIGLLPLLFLFVCRAWLAETGGRKAAARGWAAAAAALTAAWLITSFYLAWFALFFGGVFGLFWLRAADRLNPKALLALARAHGTTFAVAGAVFAVLCAPFLWVYLPKVLETGAHHFREAEKYLTTPLDPVNVGPDNLLWGWIHRLLPSFIPPSYVGGEHASGYPLIQFSLFVIAARQALKAAAPPLQRALAMTIVATWLLTIQLGPVSPWRLVFWFAPGATGLRTVVRYQLFLLLPVLILIFWTHRERWERLLATRPAAAVVLVGLLLLENVNLYSAAQLSRSAQTAALAAIPAPPAACRSFVVVKARAAEPMYKAPNFDALYPHNVDAMLLAQLWRLPTINGFSTFNPPDWALAGPTAPDYGARVQAYAARHDLHGLCRLDMRQASPWTMARP
ncbi:MAG TPA: hypothetical protein VF459_16125 [Caulobacteraceae bacterium]